MIPNWHGSPRIRVMRRALVLLLCLLMPLQAFAGMPVVPAPCPMQGMMAMEENASGMEETLAQAMEDCCNDLATFERTGQPCKSAQSCAAPAVGMPPFQPLVPQAQAAQDPLAPVWRSPPQGSLSRLWRPPTSI